MIDDRLATEVLRQKALAHPVRLRLIAMLREGELCVCQLTAATGLAASTVSAHLSELRRAGLLAERKDGRWVSYRWAREREALAALRAVADRLADDPRIGADARLIASLRVAGPEALCRAGMSLARLGIRRREPPAAGTGQRR